MVVLDTGDAANLVCFRRLPPHYRLLEKYGFQRVSIYPSKARFRFGDGRLGEVRPAADIPVGIAGNMDKFNAFVLDAHIPALVRKGAIEALGG